MTSIRWPGSPTCSPASPSIPRNGSTNCCHGIGAPVIAKPTRQLEPKLTGTRPSPDAYVPDRDLQVERHRSARVSDRRSYTYRQWSPQRDIDQLLPWAYKTQELKAVAQEQRLRFRTLF